MNFFSFFFFFFFLHKRRSPAVAQSKDEITSRRCFDVDTAGLRLAPGRNKGANNSSRVARRGGSRERTTVNYTVLIDGRRSWNAVVQGVLRSSVDHARQTGRPTRFGRDREYRQLDQQIRCANIPPNYVLRRDRPRYLVSLLQNVSIRCAAARIIGKSENLERGYNTTVSPFLFRWKSTFHSPRSKCRAYGNDRNYVVCVTPSTFSEKESRNIFRAK